MKKLLILILFVPIMSFAQVREDGGFRTLLKGTVTGVDGRELYVMTNPPMDRNIHDKYIIRIEEGKFEYLLEGDHAQEYMLVFLDEFMTGSFYRLDFFLDADVIEFTIDDIAHLNNNTVSGGAINRAMNEFIAEQKRLFQKRWEAATKEEGYLNDNDLFYNDEFKSILKQLEEIRERNDANARRDSDPLHERLNKLHSERTGLTPAAIELLERNDALWKEMMKWQYEYMTAHPDLHSYSLLLSDISSYRYHDVKPEIADMERAYAALSAANQGHPYNKTAGDGIYALNNIVAGKMFIDFTAPTLDDEMHTLSEEIKGKIAVIDLWASWCGSCRRKSVNMIPIYEKYKDRGFTVVGVAREFKNTDNFVIALRRDGYPWLNLVELDDRAGIWMKYGANNAGGRVILVDEQGKIVRLDATAEEIGEYLSLRFD